MEIILSILIGLLYTAGVYLIIRRSIVKLIIGIILFSNATNLLIFVSSGLVHSAPAFVNSTGSKPENISDPLPQALILTAIVIGFGIMAFILALKFKLYEVTGTDDLDELKETD